MPGLAVQGFAMSSNDRSVRSLQRLHMNASTARVLNLLMVFRKFGDTAE